MKRTLGVRIGGWIAGVLMLALVLGLMAVWSMLDIRILTSRVDSEISSVLLVMIVGLLATLLVGSILSVLVARMVTKPIAAMTQSALAIALGDLEQECLIYQDDEVGQLAEAFRAMIAALKEKSTAAEQIAEGKLDVRFKAASSRDTLGNAMQRMIENLNQFNKEVEILTGAPLDGLLDKRADASCHKGEFGAMISGINNMLDSIFEPIREGVSVLSAAANKDMTLRMNGHYGGHLAVLKNSINNTVSFLEDALRQVSESVEQACSISEQVENSSWSLVESITEQAGSLDRVFFCLDKIGLMNRLNAKNVEQAKVLSNSLLGSTSKGEEAMFRMNESVNKIKASSDQTEKIVKMVDEIAFQANLLALNAEVEAAHAGESGKGFSVVAEEVRFLTHRSAEAAKIIAQIVAESGKNVSGCIKSKDEFAEILVEIREETSKVNDLVHTISTVASGKVKSIEQVTAAVSKIKKIAHANASESENCASAVQELIGHTEELSQIISEFDLAMKGQVNYELKAMDVPLVSLPNEAFKFEMKKQIQRMWPI